MGKHVYTPRNNDFLGKIDPQTGKHNLSDPTESRKWITHDYYSEWNLWQLSPRVRRQEHTRYRRMRQFALDNAGNHDSEFRHYSLAVHASDRIVLMERCAVSNGVDLVTYMPQPDCSLAAHSRLCSVMDYDIEVPTYDS